MTVISGVVTVVVVPKEVVTVAAAIGVLTATVADDVGIGSSGRETVGTGTRSVEGNSEGATPPAVDGAAVTLACEPTAVWT